MNVLFVTPYFYPKPGGLEYYSYQIARGLKTRGHTVTVVTSNHESAATTTETLNGLKVYRLPRMLKLSNTPVSLQWAAELRRIMASVKPDVINAHTPVPFMADVAERVRGNVPLVLTYHNDLVKPGRLAGMLAKAAYAAGMSKTLRQADGIIATSRYYAESSPHLSKLSQPINIVPPGVDTHMFNTQVDKTWLKKTYGNRFSILFIGQMDKTHDHKGLTILLQSVAQLQNKGYDIQLIAVGRGDGIDIYKSKAADLHCNNVHFAGFVADADVPRYCAGADVLVLASTTAAEGFGMVILEANACGTPAIGTRIGGIGQAIIDDKTGLLVPPKDAQALAAAIAKIYDNPDLAKNMGATSATRVHNEFGWDKQAARTEAALLRAIQKGRS